MVNIGHFPTLTVNWIAEKKPQKKDNSFFRQLVYSCLEGIRAGETAYAFTQEQVDAVVCRAHFVVIVVKMDGCFALKKAIS